MNGYFRPILWKTQECRGRGHVVIFCFIFLSTTDRCNVELFGRHQRLFTFVSILESTCGDISDVSVVVMLNVSAGHGWCKCHGKENVGEF